MTRPVRLGRRLGLLYAFVGTIFGLGILLSVINLDAIEAQGRAVVEEDARVLVRLEDLRTQMREALASARIRSEGPVAREAATSRRRAADVNLKAIGAVLRPEEREDFLRLQRAWREAKEGFEGLADRPGRAEAVFGSRVLPPLGEAGRAIGRIEDRRRSTALARVQEIRVRVEEARTVLFLFVLFMGIVGLGAAAVLRRRILQPIRALEMATARIARGDLAHRVGSYSEDEIGDLAKRFDLMAERLSCAETARMEFLSMVSHELRSPLTILGGYIGLLAEGRRGPIAPAQAEALSILARETKRMGVLVEDLLDVARAEAGAFRAEPVPTHAARALTEALAPLAAEAEERGIGWSVDFGSLPDAVLDPRRMGQAVRNLASNALKFTPRGGRVELRGHASGEEIRIEVADTGPGIPPSLRTGIFEAFLQSSPRDAEMGGVGLGLAIVRLIARAHGGEVEIATSSGKGTVFEIRIPHRPVPPGVQFP